MIDLNCGDQIPRRVQGGLTVRNRYQAYEGRRTPEK